MAPDGITGHIVAMGGGGFSMEPDNPPPGDFVLSLAPRRPARTADPRAHLAGQDVIYVGGGNALRQEPARAPLIHVHEP